MKKAIKRILSSVMVAVMLLTVAPMSGFVGLKLNLDWLNFDWLNFSTKSSALGATGKCGDNVTYTFDSSTGLLTISGTGAMNDYNDYDNPSPFHNNSAIKTVLIEYGVTSIGDCAFYDCTGLTSVTIPDSITNIGVNIFSGCNSLVSIVVDKYNSVYDSRNNSNAVIKTTTNELVVGCKNTTIPDSVTSIGDWAFYDCTGLTSVTIPDSVTSIGDCAFYDCTGLTSVTIGKSVTSICGEAFYNCTGLTSVTIPDSVASIDNYAFYNCTSLTSVTIPDSVTSIGGAAFRNCTNLTSVTIPDSVTSICGYTFSGCTGLTSVKIGNSVTSIGYNAFYGCTGLTGVYISDIASWCNIDFGKWSNRIYHYYDSYYEYYNYSANPLNYAHKLYLNGNLVTELTIPDSVTCIGNYAFDCCTSLTSITIPDSVTSIGAYAFDCCISLTSITIPDSVTSIGAYAFDNCTNLKELTMPCSAKFSNICDSNFFDECKNFHYSSLGYDCYLEKLTLTKGNGKTDNYYATEELKNYNGYDPTDGYYTYVTYHYPFWYACNTLKKVVIEDGVTSIGSYAFYGCTGLTSVTIPDSVTSIGRYAFSGCTGLTGVYIKDIATWCNIKFGWYSNPLDYAHKLYLNDELITELKIPDGVTSISNYAFWGCTGLTSVTIPDSVTNIGYYAFSGCKNLTSITIPYSVKSIGQRALNTGSNLQSVYIFSKDCVFDTDAITKGTIYGFGGSTAETYANEHKLAFVSIDNSHVHEYDDEEDAICNLCGAERSAHQHTFGEWQVTTPATCTTKGVETRYCSQCDEFETREIEKLAHSYTSVVTKPTCTTKGYTTHTCKDCKDSYVDSYVDALGHDYKAVVKAPTCTEQGYTTHTCTRCKDSYVDSYVPAKGHTDGEWKITKQATFTEEGERTLYCKDCGAVLKTEKIVKLEHGKVYSVDISDISMDYKASKTITPSIQVDNGVDYEVKYQSSNTKVATVDDNGKVYAKGTGNATITCTVTDSYGNVVSDTCNVKVSYTWWQWIIKIVLFGWIWY